MSAQKPFAIKCSVCGQQNITPVPPMDSSHWVRPQKTDFGVIREYEVLCDYGYHSTGHKLVNMSEQVAI